MTGVTHCIYIHTNIHIYIYMYVVCYTTYVHIYRGYLFLYTKIGYVYTTSPVVTSAATDDDADDGFPEITITYTKK